LHECSVELRRVIRLDHAHHGLGAREVDPAGQERPQRELARLGMAGTPGQAVGDDKLHDGR
jgi:hypothetical protein